ncbi:MAG: aspartate-semialdehyde dehydrogenase [Coriobacteriales bacterium]|jgi:aspartate-semialdehyde dehydrogenase|nr:aspartate-semialdehyde dehydrogenase [Coriobacteriales bacterium]
MNKTDSLNVLNCATLPANPVVAVAGATGAVGREMLLVLEQRGFPAAEVRALASARSAGQRINYNGSGASANNDSNEGFLEVQEMTSESFQGVDIALFSAGASVSENMRTAVVKSGAVMIDNSSAFRMHDDVPLVVPEVNPEAAFTHNGVIANPNCSTIQMVVALAPLAQLAPIKRIVVSTYQAASGAGAKAMDELYSQTQQFLNNEPLLIQNFAHQIAFNCIPQIDIFLDDGSTKEEWKMVVETKKIFNMPDIKVAANCVRVPVLRCHAEMINVEFSAPVSVQAARCALGAANGIQLIDDPNNKLYPMPGLLAGSDDVYVGRLHADTTVEHGLAFWCVADQIRKGAALNAVQIAELLLRGQVSG